MTPEQLQKTRADRWRQNGNALMTLEDAEEWLRPLGLCLFVPRRVQLATPAPSFVEACLGEANSTPSPAAIEKATALLTRLIDKGAVVPLNLLGISGEQPDFLATVEALPFVFALRGDKDWKHEPQTAGNGRVSPLVLGIWKALERTGVQTAVEIRETMGKELTEAAILRGLSELWNAMRVIMLPAEDGEGATWELLKARYQKQMAAGAGMSQVSALSVLLAQYLESAVGATSEEAEIFLSPLSSRSKVREVVRGLTATRQLAMIGLDGQAVLYVEGTLPEFEQPVSQVTIEAAGPDLEIASSDIPAAKKIRKFIKRPPLAPGEADPLRWKRDSRVPPPAGQSRDAGRDESREDRPDSQGFDRRSPSKAPGRFAAGRPAAGGRPSRPGQARPDQGRPRPEGSGFDRPDTERTSRPAGAGKFERPSRPFSRPAREQDGDSAARPGGFAAGADRPSGSRPSFARTSGARTSGPRTFGSRPFGSSPAGGRTFGKGAPDRPSRGPSTGSGQGSRDRGPGTFEKKPRWVPREGGGTDNRSGPGRSSAARPGSARPGTGRDFADRGAAGKPRRDFSGSRPPGAGGDSRPFNRPAAGGFKSRAPRPERPDRPTTDRPAPNRPFSERPGSSAPGARSGSYSSSSRPSTNRPSTSRPPSSRTSPPFNKAGSGGFKPRSGGADSSRPFSPRSSAPRSTSAGGFVKKPRWVPREGGGAGGNSGAPRSSARPSFGARSSSGGRPSSGSARPYSGSGRPSSGGSSRPSSSSRPPSGDRPPSSRPNNGPGGRPTGNPGFGRKPGGKPAFGKKRPGPGGPSRGTGDYPKRKRPE